MFAMRYSYTSACYAGLKETCVSVQISAVVGQNKVIGAFSAASLQTNVVYQLQFKSLLLRDEIR